MIKSKKEYEGYGKGMVFVEATLSLLRLGEVPLDIDSTQRMLIEAQQQEWGEWEERRRRRDKTKCQPSIGSSFTTFSSKSN